MSNNVWRRNGLNQRFPNLIAEAWKERRVFRGDRFARTSRNALRSFQATCSYATICKSTYSLSFQDVRDTDNW